MFLCVIHIQSVSLVAMGYVNGGNISKLVFVETVVMNQWKSILCIRLNYSWHKLAMYANKVYSLIFYTMNTKKLILLLNESTYI